MAAAVVEMNQADYARHRGVSRAAIGKAIKNGRIPASAFRDDNGEKKIDVAAADLALGQSRQRVNSATAAATADELPLAPAAAGSAAPAAAPGLTEARTQEAQISARLKQLDFERQVAKALSADDVVRSMERCAEALVRDIDQLSARADDIVTAYTRNGVAGVRLVLKDIARDIRATIANNMRLLAESDDVDEIDAEAEQPAPAAAPGDQPQELAS